MIQVVYQVVGFKLTKKQFLEMLNFKVEDEKYRDDEEYDFISDHSGVKLYKSEVMSFRLHHDIYKKEDGMLIGIPVLTLVIDTCFGHNKKTEVTEIDIEKVVEAKAKLLDWLDAKEIARPTIKLYTTTNNCGCCS
jgi:hypothetical protein